jgi:hypothetical protein
MSKTPAAIPEIPIRRDQIHGTERSTNIWTSESVPFIRKKTPRNVTSETSVALGAVININPKKTPAIPWSRKTHQTLERGGRKVKVAMTSKSNLDL